MPKVSIIMPFFNSEAWLDESITSILNQSFKNFELILINDASTDKSMSVLKKHKDSRIIIIENTVRKGLARCLNDSFQVASGEFIARMDADDISHELRLDCQVKYLDKYKKIDLIGSFANLIDQNGRNLGLKRKPITSSFCNLYARFATPVIHPTIMFRRSLIDDGFLYPDWPRGQDYGLMVFLIANDKQIANVGRCLLKYRVNLHKDHKKNNISRIAAFSSRYYIWFGRDTFLPKWKKIENNYNQILDSMFNPMAIIITKIILSVETMLLKTNECFKKMRK